MAFACIWTGLAELAPNLFVHIFMTPTEGILDIAPGIIRSYSLSFLLLPVVAGAGAIWFAMPLTELIVAVYVAMKMKQYTKQLPKEN